MDDPNDEKEFTKDTETLIAGNNTDNLNPWSEPTRSIAWGFILTSFTLNFFYLQYILPTIGIICLYLGFRDLHKCNRAFHIAWIIASLRLFWQLILLILYATPFYIQIIHNNIFIFTTIVISILHLFVYRHAIRSVFWQANLDPERDPILSFIVWLCITSICAYTKFASIWIIALPLIISYFIVSHSLYMYEDKMFGIAPYYIMAPVKSKKPLLTLGYLSCSLILILTSCCLSNHIVLSETTQSAIAENDTRAKLVALGFPKNIIGDIGNQDIALLKNAIYIETYSDELKFIPDYLPQKSILNKYKHPSKKGNMKATTIYVELPDHLVYILEYFDWMSNRANWQDGFTIWGQKNLELLNGVLIYQKNKAQYTAPIPRLKCENIVSNGFFGSNTTNQISGAVSYPFQSTHQRGYLFYRTQLGMDDLGGCNCMNYIHNKYPFKYPYVKTEQIIQNGSFNTNDLMRQHYTNFGLKESPNPVD